MRSLTTEKILFVDDDPHVLAGYQRLLRKHFVAETAPGGAEALELVRKDGPYAVVVADMRMPSMNGIEFLRQVYLLAPDTIRMMLTGNADQQTAIDAVNEGHIFRFLTKPCPPETMIRVLEAGLAQYRLVTAEKELLEKTLTGSISILIEVLSMTDPHAFGRVKKLRAFVGEIAGAVGYRNPWELEMAALLSRIGHLTIPVDVILKSQAKTALTELEQEILGRVPEISGTLLGKIPRLEAVAQIIRYSNKLYNGVGLPKDTTAGDKIPLGSRILKIASDLMDMEAEGTPRSVAVRLMHNRHGWYDTQLLEAITAYLIPPLPVTVPKTKTGAGRMRRTLNREAAQATHAAILEQPPSIEITLGDLLVGDVLALDLYAADGSLLLSAGNLITEPILEKLNNYARLKGIQQPIHVAVSED